MIARKGLPALAFPAKVVLAVAALLSVGLLGASPASAAFEQVGCFAGSLPGPVDSCKPVSEEKFGEEVQLGGVGGMAVNYTGAGGVPPGTVYAATLVGSTRVEMFTPEASQGGLEFSQSWQVTDFEGPYNRCGPALGTECAARVKEGPGRVDVDIDQTTGNVYVYNSASLSLEKQYIVAYTPDGSEVITRFGERVENVKTADTPDKLHTVSGKIAVGGAGRVYVFDLNNFDNFYHRLMVFEPQSPGDYENYVYAGEVAAGVGGGRLPTQPVVDGAGNVYVVSQTDTTIEMFAPEAPAPYPAPEADPLCTYEHDKGGITAITPHPQTGEVFFFSYKLPKRLFRLGPCDPETGEFTELEPEPEALGVAPPRDDLRGLAFDPLRQVDPQRAPGVLYGGAPSPVPGENVGTGEAGQSSLGYIFARTKEVPPAVESQSVSDVTATGAQLLAEIAPNGYQTHYVFQYVTEAAYQEGGESFAGATEAPPGGATLKSTGEPETVGASLAGLSPDTAYRYRAVATSNCSEGEPEKVCEDAGEAQSFRTFPLEEPGLADGRAYELVSPAQKNGGQVLPADPEIRSCLPAECKPGDNYVHFPMLSTADGEAVVYEGTSFGNGEGASIENAYIARRTAAGWQSVNLTPPLLTKAAQGYTAFDEALSEGVLGQPRPALSPEAPPEYENLYAQPSDDPLALRPLVVVQPPNRPGFASGEFKLTYAGASADLSRVFFEANDALTGETAFAPAAVDGGPAKFNLYEWERATGQLRLVNVMPGNTETAAGDPEAGAGFGVPSANTISADGSRAFWSDEAGQLYVREDAEATKEIPDSGKFLSAATDGSKVLLDNGHVYDLEQETTADLTEGKGGFKGIAGQSDDLSHVYFVATEVLTGEEENSEGDKAQAGKFNLYAWEEGSARYVATLLASDNSNAPGVSPSSSWLRFPFARSAQASPAGRYLTFLSHALLTGYENTGPCGVLESKLVDGPCPQVFLYDSVAEELSCPSCNPTGTPPLGHSALRRIKSSGVLPSPLPQPHYLTDSGRLYFDSRDSLTLADTNEGVEDVYQYEPQGLGSCKRAGGCVSLISAGTGTVDSNLLAVDETGKSTFFTSRDRLAAKDKDELIDLYVAREGGGIAAETETLRPECQGEACQPAAFAPNDSTPGSSSFQGPGNVKEGKARPRCPKGRRQVKRKGRTRCVKPKRNRARAAKRKHTRTANRNRGGRK